jgi:hypothetical protein
MILGVNNCYFKLEMLLQTGSKILFNKDLQDQNKEAVKKLE